MIVLQDDIDVRPVKVDWYWSSAKPSKEDGTLRTIRPEFILTGDVTVYEWDAVEW